jgi:hypothetical protein
VELAREFFSSSYDVDILSNEFLKVVVDVWYIDVLVVSPETYHFSAFQSNLKFGVHSRASLLLDKGEKLLNSDLVLHQLTSYNFQTSSHACIFSGKVHLCKWQSIRTRSS